MSHHITRLSASQSVPSTPNPGVSGEVHELLEEIRNLREMHEAELHESQLHIKLLENDRCRSRRKKIRRRSLRARVLSVV